MGKELDAITAKEGDFIDVLEGLQAYGITPARDLCKSAIHMAMEKDGQSLDSLIRMAREKLDQVDATIDRLMDEYGKYLDQLEKCKEAIEKVEKVGAA